LSQEVVDKILNYTEKSLEKIKDELNKVKKAPKIKVLEDEMHLVPEKINSDVRDSIITQGARDIDYQFEDKGSKKENVVFSNGAEMGVKGEIIEQGNTEMAEIKSVKEKGLKKVEPNLKTPGKVFLPKKSNEDRVATNKDMLSLSEPSLTNATTERSAPKKSLGPIIVKEVKTIEKQENSEKIDAEIDSVSEVKDTGKTASIIRQASNTSKKRMDDVKHMPRLTGPEEELRQMSVHNFRLISKSPTVSTNKILEKISLLEDESYTKKISGLKAWRQSPLNVLYLQIGRDSIKKKKTVNEVINSLPDEEKITVEEFEAIMELNKKTRF